MRTEFTLSPEQVKKFWTKVDQSAGPDACWPWLGQMNQHGYGRFLVSTKPASKVTANRLAWFLANGPIPEDHVIAHRCDNPPCCNPSHLIAMTQTENVRDRNNKGRQVSGPNAPQWQAPSPRQAPRGERANRARLTEDQVREIRRLYAAGGIGQKELARIYGVWENAIWMIVHRKSWSHVD